MKRTLTMTLKSQGQSVFDDPVVHERFALCDRRARKRTRHDMPHGRDVANFSNTIAVGVHERFPELLDEETREVVIPVAGLLHDIGYADDVDKHHLTGARWAWKYLRSKGFSTQLARRICMIIANHRSSRVLNCKFNDPAWAIVVIADKCVGDEDRVRPWPLFGLRLLRMFNACRFWPGSMHDRANYAIKNASVKVVNDDSAIVLTIQMDDKVCSPKDIYTLYHLRFHSCGRAAKYLGYKFCLEFNGVRYTYSEEHNSWQPQT